MSLDDIIRQNKPKGGRGGGETVRGFTDLLWLMNLLVISNYEI